MGTVRYYGAEDVRDGEYGPALQRLADELRGGVLVVTTLACRPGPTDAGLLFCARHGDPFICDITGGYYLGRVRHVDPHGGEWSATVWDADRGHANLLPGWVHQAAGQADVDREAQGEPAVQAVVGCDGPRMVWITLLALPDAGIPRSLWELESIVAVFCGGFGGPTREVPLPAEVGQLPNLEHLMLRGNRLTAVPSEIGQLHELQTLDLSGNELEELPTTMRQLDNLRVLFLHGNDALDIPPEVLGRDREEVEKERGPANPADILAYYFRGREERTQPLNEAKILLVGQGAVGKTSLVNRLVDNRFDPDEKKTEGINITRWQIPGKDDPGAGNIRLNIWDFGGQEIMHATHQFFLTKRSLYLLVLDARKGENESNIHYWLRVIQSYGSDSPVLIVINKHEPPNHLGLNETRLRKDFEPNVVGFFKTSCPNGEGIAELKAAIQEQIHNLPHVYDRVPVSYFRVKEELEKEADNKDFIDIADYRDLCIRGGVNEENHQNALLRFLHDLGNVLHFDDPGSPLQLQETKVLNPEWVTGGVYKILNNHMLMQHGGVLEKLQLAGVLADPEKYPPERQQFIVDMMRQFELCFAFPDSGGTKFLIPELLLPNEPDLNWDERDALNFEYHYKVLPDGIIPRFIVRTHDKLTDRPTYWRSGVVLEIGRCRALVRGETSVGKVFVSVRGPVPAHRRNALAVIREEFRRIHATIPRIGAEEKVPLPDSAGVTVGYRTLLNHEEQDLDKIMPDGAERLYAVQELLNGIEDKNKRVAKLEKRLREFDLERRPDTPKPESTRSIDTQQIKPGNVFLLLVVAVVPILGLFAGSVFVATRLGLDNVTTGVVSVVFPILALAFVALLVGRITGKNLTEIFKAVLRTGSSTGASDSE